MAVSALWMSAMTPGARFDVPTTQSNLLTRRATGDYVFVAGENYVAEIRAPHAPSNSATVPYHCSVPRCRGVLPTSLIPVPTAQCSQCPCSQISTWERGLMVDGTAWIDFCGYSTAGRSIGKNLPHPLSGKTKILS